MPAGYDQSIGKRREAERKTPPAVVWLPRRGTFAPPLSTSEEPVAILDRLVTIDVAIYAAQTQTDDDESQDFDAADEAIADVVRAISATIPTGALGWVGEDWDESHGAVEDGRLCTISFLVRVPLTELAPTRAPVNGFTITKKLQLGGQL